MIYKYNIKCHNACQYPKKLLSCIIIQNLLYISFAHLILPIALLSYNPPSEEMYTYYYLVEFYTASFLVFIILHMVYDFIFRHIPELSFDNDFILPTFEIMCNMIISLFRLEDPGKS